MTRLTAIATLLLSIGTLVLAFATVMLWLSTRDLVIDAEKTAERQLRAYLYVDLDIEASDL